MRQAFFIMPYNPYNGQSNHSSNDPIQNAFNNYATYYGEGSSGLQDTIIGSWFNPGLVQDKEFAQQVSLQQMQNDWNSAPNQMELMKKAGINANVAAQGIAGAGNSPSVSAPNSAVGAGAAGIGSAAQMVGAASEALNSGINAYEKTSLTGVEKDRRKAEIRNLLSAALHNDWLAYSISEMLPLQQENERADTYLKLANFDKAREEKKLVIKRISEAEENITRIKNEAALLEKQGNYVDAQKLYVQAETEQVKLENDKLQWDKDWRTKYKYDNNAPVDVALEQAMVNDAPEDVVSAIGDSVKTVSYNTQKGFNDAEIEDAYIKAYNGFKAKADVDADFAPYLAMIEANKSSIIEFVKTVLDNPNDLKGLFAKLVNLIGQFGLSSQLDKGPVNNATKPHAGVIVVR